ncbi:MAG: flagellar hook-associated protein FlgL [Bacteriovoracaceae bacterium]|nr:flagellar hook-associated protein FlgL [Bacteriovoracaceae bacterium]
MTRVSEQSSFHAINHAVGKTKSRLEDLQLKGANLKRVQKPSDDPLGNTELLAIRSQDVDNEQFGRNISFAKAQLAFVENAIEELTNIVSKAKELAIGQASNFYDADIRKSVSKEVEQLKKQMISIGNRRMGNKYVFAGHKNLSKPFNEKGEYFGDGNSTNIEVSKDFFVPINFSGKDVFFTDSESKLADKKPKLPATPIIEGEEVKEMEQEPTINRSLASEKVEQRPQKSIIHHIQALEDALTTNNPEIIQGLLPVLDKDMDNLVRLRTTIGSTINSIDNAFENIEKTKLLNAEYKSNIEDADVAELFTDLTRQQSTLEATYKASAQLMNKSLMDFMR